MVRNFPLLINTAYKSEIVSTNQDGQVSVSMKWNSILCDVRPWILESELFKYATKNADIVTFNPNTTGNVDVSITPYGFLKIHLKNVLPCDDQERIRLYGADWHNHSQHPSYQGNCDEVNFFITDLNKQTFPVVGSRYSMIEWELEKDGQKTKFQDSIFVPSHDTASYYLEY